MPTTILMPALSPTMEKGNLAKWLKKEGDSIKSGDVIAEIETDKATMEVEAVDEGTLARIVVPAGTEDVAVNQVIGIIAAAGEDAAAVAKDANEGAGKAAPSSNGSAGTVSAPQGLAYERQPEGVPPAAKAEERHEAVSAGGGANGRVFASPLARRLAREGNLDLAGVQGSGPHGRIVERDIKQALAEGPKPAPAPAPEAKSPAPAASPPAAKPPAPAGSTDAATRKLFAEGSFEEVPHEKMRQVIARRLTEAKQTIPHFYLSADMELDALLALREQINASSAKDKDGKPAFKVSVNDFVIKALAVALMRVPDANVTWTDTAMLRHKAADIGVAVSIPGGLITPVIRNADAKTLSAISNEMKDYAARARARKLKPEEYQGGTSAVSNLGMFGVKSFQAIVNPPHASILAVGAGEKRIVVKNGAPAVATVMTCTLSTDHRAVDGALGAELMAAFKALIENPMGMLV